MSYPGSKAQSGTWQRIIGQMPPHSVYVEPFFGSGQIFHAKLPAANSVLIDRNPTVFRNLADDGYVETILGDAMEWLPLLAERKLVSPSDEPLGNFLDGAVIYCDPPYPLSTRAGRKYYEHEMTDDDHAALLSTLLQLKCHVMISSYPNALYSSQLREWRCVRYQTMTRGGKRVECLWCNFPEPTELHDWRFAGRNFRERWAFEKARRNILAKLDKMQPRKRGFVLDALASRILTPDSARCTVAAGNAGKGVVAGVNAQKGAAGSK